jgi:hypothetical protein
MLDYMEELVSAWVGWLRHRDAVQIKVIRFVKQTNDRFRNDEERRQVELKRLQRSFYRVAIADKLLEMKIYSSKSPRELLGIADEILDKRGCKIGIRGRDSNMRTPSEERLYTTVRVRWSYLLKKARVRAADSRGGDTSYWRDS